VKLSSSSIEDGWIGPGRDQNFMEIRCGRWQDEVSAIFESFGDISQVFEKMWVNQSVVGEVVE
jgi:hypothetical protein